MKHLFYGTLWLLLLPVYIWIDRDMARWLPWWRRYAPSALVAAHAICTFAREDSLSNWVFVAWAIAYIANRYTSNKNRRNGKDHKKLEAEAGRLTEVQQQAFGRQVAEVRT